MHVELPKILKDSVLSDDNELNAFVDCGTQEELVIFTVSV